MRSLLAELNGGTPFFTHGLLLESAAVLKSSWPLGPGFVPVQPRGPKGARDGSKRPGKSAHLRGAPARAPRVRRIETERPGPADGTGDHRSSLSGLLRADGTEWALLAACPPTCSSSR